MATLQEVFKDACELYNSLAGFLEKLYDNWKSEIDFDFTKEDLMKGYDHYIQCYLLKISLADRKFDKMELQYIQKIVRYNNFLDVDNDMEKNNTFEMRKALVSWADEGLKTTPLFAVFMAVLEKSNPQGGDDNWPKTLLNALLQLGHSIMLMDGEAEKAEIEDAVEALHAVIDYYGGEGFKLTD